MESQVINSMCRCCASEGAFKDINTAYQWMGEEEVYGDILKECFDVTLTNSEDGCGGICEVCITQLRNASNFKKQVLHTEEQFKNKSITIFKANPVKLELIQDGNVETDDNVSADDGAQSDLDYDVDIKSEDEEPKPKKRAAAKASTSRTKKQKRDITDTKRNTRGRRMEVIMIGGDKNVAKGKTKKKDEPRKVKLSAKKVTQFEHTDTLGEILKCTNATPIRRFHVTGYLCSYCDEMFERPPFLKLHTLKTHKDVCDVAFMRKNITEFTVKLDITALKCKLCHVHMESVPEAVSHLKLAHQKNTTDKYIQHIVPFKFDSESFRCCICLTEFNKLNSLQLHMHSHFDNARCDECNEAFITRRALQHHKLIHAIGVFNCRFCDKTFNTKLKVKLHEKTKHFDRNTHKCPYCEEKLVNNKYKWKHIAEVHNIPLPTYKCNACDKSFNEAATYRRHIKRDHLLDRRYECNFCDKAFYTKYTLREHVNTHTKMSRYECDICNHSFSKKWSWAVHMRNKHEMESIESISGNMVGNLKYEDCSE